MPYVRAMDGTWSVGVDLGGTKIEAVLIRRWQTQVSHTPALQPQLQAHDAFEPDALQYEIVTRRRVPTDSGRGYQAVLETTRALIADVSSTAPLDAGELELGVGMPGSVTRDQGLVKNSNTLCLNGKPFRQDLSRALNRPIAFENDANCFALAEARLGAGKDHVRGIVFGVILGTGVGGGIVIDGRVWAGPQQIAGEWGHHAVGPCGMVSDADTLADTEHTRAPDHASGLHGLSPRPPCYCGKRGCLELYLSGPAIERDYSARSGNQLPLAEIAQRRSQDAFAAAAIEAMLEAFGRGLANLIDILDPSAIVLGGGVSNLDFLLTEGRQRIARYVFNDTLTTPVLRNTLGDSAGVLGAALLNARAPSRA